MTKVIKKSLLAIFLLFFPEKKKNILVDAPDALPNMPIIEGRAISLAFGCGQNFTFKSKNNGN